MRDPIRILYYPDFWVSYATLLKSILLFDELHFMDRPSMMFGNFGTIAASSPLRAYEESFRKEGIPLYVHPAPQGPVVGEWLDHVTADVNDLDFLNRFQNGLRTSPTFRALQIAPGNYGKYGNEDDVAKKLISVNIPDALSGHGSAMDLFNDESILHLDLSTDLACAKNLVADAVICSAKMNFALNTGVRASLVPLADATPYGNLLGTKYARAIKAAQTSSSKVQLTDLSFAIFDELFPDEKLKQLTIGDAVRYRKDSTSAREAFLEHLAEINSKQSSVAMDGDYSAAVQRIIVEEVRPAVREFKNRLAAIDDKLFGDLAKGAGLSTAGISGILFLGDLSWQRILALAGTAAAYVLKTAVDAIVAERAARRECSISYILSLDS